MPAGPPRAANEDLSNTVEAAVPNTKAAPALIEGVEGLRSICCVLILAVHYQDYVSEHTKTPSEDMPLIQQLFWAVWTRDANFTVDVYFIIAGFVGELSSKEAHSWKLSNCSKTLLKKFIRLAPAYYTCTLLWLVLHYLGIPCQVHTLTVALNLLMLQAWPVFDARSQIRSPFLFVGFNYQNIPFFYNQEECPDGSVVNDPAEINDPTWFVSCLFGCYIIHIFLAPVLLSKLATSGCIRCATLALLFAVLRALQYDRFGQMPGWPGGWMSRWPPFAYFAFAAGAYTARLVQQLPASVLDYRVWLGVDLVLVALWAWALYATSLSNLKHPERNFDWLVRRHPHRLPITLAVRRLFFSEPCFSFLTHYVLPTSDRF